MNPDDIQQVWRSQSSKIDVTNGAELLLKEVQRNADSFNAMILGRDVRELVVGAGLIPIWFFLGFMWNLPWSWYLTVPALIWSVGFIWVDRVRRSKLSLNSGEPLRLHVQNSLTEVEHQIWLLKNVVWWYLMPISVAISIFFLQVAWQVRSGGVVMALFLICDFAIVGLIFYYVYGLNQDAVKKMLEPRRQELVTLLANLDGEVTNPPERH